MARWLGRAAVCAAFGALAAAAAAIGVFSLHPDVVFEMDRPLPRQVVSGLYPPERAGDYTFAWTSGQAAIALPGLPRRFAWDCAVRLRGARADAGAQPDVVVALDGLTAARTTATNDPRDVHVAVPERATGDGLTLTLTVTPTVVPGGTDLRELGVQIDRLSCAPAAGGLVTPPRAVTASAMQAGAILGLALGLTGMGLAPALGALLVIAAVQAVPLTSGPAPFGRFGATVVVLAAWIGAGTVAVLAVLRQLTRRRVSPAARFAVVFSAAALFLKLEALLHPSKLIIDAVFHAHRLEWVLGGRYYFTQGMPSGVSFPYAIGLYVFAAPWAAIASDHVALLRVVVTTVEVVAGALLYPLILRAWNDRLAAAIAVALFNVVPLPYELIGNANFTNAFGTSIALVAMIAAAGLTPARGALGQSVVLFAITALAFLSHVSTFALLGVTLVASAGFFWWKGGEELRAPAKRTFAVALVAATFAVAVYYGHFGEVYANALRVRATAPTATASPDTAVTASRPVAPVSLAGRVGGALALTRTAVGWPVLVLAAIGVWRRWASHGADRLTLVLAAWAVAYLAFLGVGVMRVDAPFQRYAAEFVGRVVFATYPAAVILAAAGAAWAWRAGAIARVAVNLVLLAALVEGLQRWHGWFA